MLKIYFYVFLMLAFLSPVTNAVSLDILLPMVYQEDIDISNWVMSEKLDGIRGYWDGKKLLSKNGLPFNPPEAFTKNLPDFAVEGELWGGRNTFERTSGIVMRHEAHDGWLDLKFGIFDVPQAGGGFLQRLNMAIQWFEIHPSEYAFVIKQKTVKGKDHLKEELLRVETLGGEGLIVRNPDSFYTIGRSAGILKVKSYYDMEATVMGHIEGTGRNYGRMGSILVELKDRTQFKIGTGFSDEERNNPPPIGAIITFRYYGFYKSGIPKFPSFMRTVQPR
jgi:DNA ligase-1